MSLLRGAWYTVGAQKMEATLLNMNKTSYLKNGQSCRITSIKREQQDYYVRKLKANIYGALRKRCWRLKFKVLQNVLPQCLVVIRRCCRC